MRALESQRPVLPTQAAQRGVPRTKTYGSNTTNEHFTPKEKPPKRADLGDSVPCVNPAPAEGLEAQPTSRIMI
jgi:hypothetical protein